MTSPEQRPPLVRYTLLKDGTHELVYIESSHDAVDEWAAHFERIATTTPLDTTAYYLVDLTHIGMGPVSYAVSRAREIMQRVPDRARSRVAILYPPSVMFSLIDAFLRAVRLGDYDVVRYFPHTERERALAWLREKDKGT